VKALIAAGANVNAKDRFGETALMFAAAVTRNIRIVKLLIADGADVHAKTEDGDTALIIAAKRGHTGIVELLKKAGARQ
jgi:ankyrin repeat protein